MVIEISMAVKVKDEVEEAALQQWLFDMRVAAGMPPGEVIYDMRTEADK